MANANIVVTPRYWKKKLVLFKAEAAYGVDALPTGLANWIEARNVSLTAYDAETADRGIEQPYFGNSGKVILSSWSKVSFDVALAGSGTPGLAPKWAPLLLGSSFAETLTPDTSAIYNLVSAALGSVTGYLNIDGTLHKFFGSRGNVKLKLAAKGVPMLSFEFTSLYNDPAAVVAPTVDRSGWIVEEGVNAANTSHITIDGVDMAWSEINCDIGNEISRVNLPGPQVEVVIGDRKPTADVTVVAPALQVFNPYALASKGDTLVISTTHGSVAGKQIKTELKVRIVGVAETEIEKLFAYKLTLEPTPVLGNDEITITCL